MNRPVVLNRAQVAQSSSVVVTDSGISCWPKGSRALVSDTQLERVWLSADSTQKFNVHRTDQGVFLSRVQWWSTYLSLQFQKSGPGTDGAAVETRFLSLTQVLMPSACR